MALPEQVKIVEVGPRDGLQNQPLTYSPEQRATLIGLLVKAGLKHIEAGSFVSPRYVPQMSGTAEVMKRIVKTKGITYCALTPNLRGVDDALEAGVDEIAVFGSASEGFSQHNLNCSVTDSLKHFEKVIGRARSHNVAIRGYISCIVSCPYDGETPVNRVASLCQTLYDMGCYELSLGDTIGVGTPLKIKKVFEAAARNVPLNRLAAHFHNTYGQALANIYAVLEEGVSVLDAAVSGLGGCPYAPGASGNLATEDVVYLLEGMGVRTGVDLSSLLTAAAFVQEQLKIPSRSSAGLALQGT